MTGGRRLKDDCFLHDSDRMRHEEVLVLLAERLAPVVGTETISTLDALGRTAAADVLAGRTVPGTDNAAVDGYAFAHADYLSSGGRLPVSGRLAAGDAPHRVGTGNAARIFTGAPMPPDADTVAMQEDCRADDGVIHVPPGLKSGANRRRAGEDVMPDTRIVSQGESLSAAHLAALASTGHSQVSVHEQLRVALLSTGAELRQPGEPAAAHEVYDANRPMLAALARGPKTIVSDLGQVGDDAQILRQRIEAAAANHHLVITSGGASRGEEDHMVELLAERGACHLWQIAVKPGRPMMFGQIGDCVIIGLPGNPVAAFVCFHLYVRPVMAHLTGTRWRPPQGYMLPADFSIARKKRDRREFLRAWTQTNGNGERIACKFGRDGSGLISGLRAATGFVELAENVQSVEEGEPVRFVPLSEFDL